MKIIRRRAIQCIMSLVLPFLSAQVSATTQANGYGSATIEPTVEEIVKRANYNAFYSGNDGRAEARMTIVDNKGRQQLRQFTVLRQDISDGGDQNFLVIFSRPADIRNTVFLINKHVNKDDNRWLYLPGLDLVKRIAAGDKRTSFVGSHFLYEDISGRNLDNDKHKLIGKNENFYIVKNTPIEPEIVEFSYYTVWVNKSNFMPVKTEYFDKNNTLYRRIEILELQDIQGYITATTIKASDLNDNSYTINELRYIQYNIGIESDAFSERSLRSPPKQWLKRP